MHSRQARPTLPAIIYAGRRTKSPVLRTIQRNLKRRPTIMLLLYQIYILACGIVVHGLLSESNATVLSSIAHYSPPPRSSNTDVSWKQWLPHANPPALGDSVGYDLLQHGGEPRRSGALVERRPHHGERVAHTTKERRSRGARATLSL